MKKLLLVMILVFATSLLSFATAKQRYANSDMRQTNIKSYSHTPSLELAIGYIDINKILKSYSKYQDFQSNQKIALAEIQEFTANAQKEINAGITQEEKKQLTDKYSKEINKKKEAFKTLYEPQMRKLKYEIDLAIKTVAQKNKLSAIFKKDSLVYGGTDVTGNVISELNKK